MVAAHGIPNGTAREAGIMILSDTIQPLFEKKHFSNCHLRYNMNILRVALNERAVRSLLGFLNVLIDMLHRVMIRFRWEQL